jgi:GNAT superfamily N-acetyltransferase
MIEVREEDLTSLWDEAMPLFEAHWREIAHYQDIVLDIDREAYAALERADVIRMWTARAAGRLVGYVIFFVRPNMHYRASKQALQDVLFLLPEYRRGPAGLTLIRVAETRLRDEGVQVVYHHAKRTNRVGELLGRLGYELVDEIWAKRLDLRRRR